MSAELAEHEPVPSAELLPAADAQVLVEVAGAAVGIDFLPLDALTAPPPRMTDAVETAGRSKKNLIDFLCYELYLLLLSIKPHYDPLHHKHNPCPPSMATFSTQYQILRRMSLSQSNKSLNQSNNRNSKSKDMQYIRENLL